MWEEYGYFQEEHNNYYETVSKGLKSARLKEDNVIGNLKGNLHS